RASWLGANKGAPRTCPGRRRQPADSRHNAEFALDLAGRVPAAREQQHLLHRLWAVRLGADEMACELESPTAQSSGIIRSDCCEFLLKPDFVMDFEPGGFQAAGHMGSCISSVGPQFPSEPPSRRNPPPPPPPPLSQAEASLTRDLSRRKTKSRQRRRSRRSSATVSSRRQPQQPASSRFELKSFADGGETKNNEMDDQSEKNAGSEPLSGLMYNSLQKAPSTQYAESELGTERMPSVGTPRPASPVPLKKIARLVEEDTINKELLVQNLRYAVQVLEAVYEDETNEVRDWLASTFTRSQTSLKQNKEKPHFRERRQRHSSGHHGGEAVLKQFFYLAEFCHDRIYRRLSSSSSISVPPNVLLLLKAGLDEWCLDAVG
uniref:PDEase_I_N domain-containing protein n=1 Tax=Macrostomum lignano TaxID=282301 RepID=A0A1I8FL34_9PLAT